MAFKKFKLITHIQTTNITLHNKHKAEYILVSERFHSASILAKCRVCSNPFSMQSCTLSNSLTYIAVDTSSCHHTTRHHFNFYSAYFRLICITDVLLGAEFLMYLIHLSKIAIQKHDYAVRSFPLITSLLFLWIFSCFRIEWTIAFMR